MHNLEITLDGTGSFVSVRQDPWHHLGIVWPEELSLLDALRLARADYEVSMAPIYAYVDGKTVKVEGRSATVRMDPDTGRPIVLGDVSETYEVMQNVEAFRFGETLLDEGMLTETCGVLGQGERAFMCFRSPKDLLVAGKDAVNLYLTVVTGHDGRTPLKCLMSPTRVVCQNTLNMATGNAVRSWTVRHTLNMRTRVEEARRALELTYAYADDFQELAELLAASSFSGYEFEEFLKGMFPIPEGAQSRTVTRVENIRSEVTDLYRVAPTQAGFRDTRWAAYNAVAEHVDYYRSVRAPRIDETTARAMAIVEGRADVLKDKALALLTN